MPRGASPKREREYKELKHRFKEEHRYPGREEEVASRIVNKQRREQGETKREKKEERDHKNPDRNLPIENYRHLTVDQVVSRLGDLSEAEVRKIRNYEKSHKNRKTLMEQLG